MSDDGLEIVLSPIQLAAILENDTLDERSCKSCSVFDERLQT